MSHLSLLWFSRLSQLHFNLLKPFQDLIIIHPFKNPPGDEDERSAASEVGLPEVPRRLQRLRRHVGRARSVSGRQRKDQGDVLERGCIA